MKGENRTTPNGRRVSVWEDELQQGTDADVGWASEVGLQAFYQPVTALPMLRISGAVVYTNTFGYQSFFGGDDFYTNTLGLSFGLRRGL